MLFHSESEVSPRMTTEYSPYNPRNIPVSAEDIRRILRTCGIQSYHVKNITTFQKPFVHSTYVRRPFYTTLTGEPATLAPCPPNVMDLQTESYETFEFLGDSILGCCVADYLHERYPELNPGFLTNTRKLIVRNRTLGLLARDHLKLDTFFVISKHVEEMKPEHGRQNLEKLGDVLEAFIAALWLDSGKSFPLVYEFVTNMIETYLDIPTLLREDDNYKDRMQKFCQQQHHYTPVYKMLSSDEKKGEFVMAVCTPAGEILGKGTASTKKQAEQNACKDALQQWNVL
jgi:ribonuclease III